MSSRILRGWAATNGPIRGHPDLRHSEGALVELADALRAGRVPFHLDHNEAKRFVSRVLQAEVRQVDADTLGVWLEIEVEGDDALIGELELRKGFSIAFAAGQRLYHSNKVTAGELQLYADAVSFDQDAVFEAAEALSEEVTVRAGFYYQFNFIPPPKVVLVVGIEVLKALGAAVFVDSVRRLIRHRTTADTETEFSLHIVESDGRQIEASFKTNEPEVARDALETLQKLADQALPPRIEYTSADNRWREIPGPGRGVGAAEPNMNDVGEEPEPSEP